MPADEPRSWPFEEARKVLKRTGGAVPGKGYVLLQTGYGPSGLPHIGTFGEVVRTQMVRRALAELSDMPSKLFAFSDDMDGLRKVPENIPNADMMESHLGKPLTAIPDPFGTHESFGHHNNARLQGFLDDFGFDYEFKSATECYKSGTFDSALLAVLADYERITNVILPTLGPERRATYSPFLPVCPDTGRVLQAPVVARDVDAGTIAYEAEDGRQIEVPVTGGHCKLQWKADWAMRWVALGVDYEMSGKDLIDSVKLSGRICRLLGARPPEGFTYELFLDEAGEKISKSRGNGLSVEEWLAYAPTESLALFMYGSPRKAKRLYFDIIPRQVDDYMGWLEKFPGQSESERRDNPAWHIHAGDPPPAEGHVGFGLLLNLASVCNAEDKAMLWGLHHPLRARRDAGERAVSRPAGRACHRLLPGLREAQQDLSPAERGGAGGDGRSRRCAGSASAGRRCRGDSERGLPDRQGARFREPSRLVPCALRGSCWARIRARASALSSPSTESRRRSP